MLVSIIETALLYINTETIIVINLSTRHLTYSVRTIYCTSTDI